MNQKSSKDPGGQTANKGSVDETVCKESTYQNSSKVSTDQTASRLGYEQRNYCSDCSKKSVGQSTSNAPTDQGPVQN